MKDLKKLTLQILEQGYLMSLATVDESGPWVADVIYVFEDNFSLYWLSQEKTRHSQAILVNQKVAATITVSNKGGEDNVGLQLEGIAEKIDGNIFEMAVKHRAKRKKPTPKENEQFLDEGESWYKLTPKKIEIIYEPLWGFEKQSLDINS